MACDRVAVVGGSSAGLFAAWLLAREGRPVRVFEQRRRLDLARRALIVTDRIRGLLGPLAEGLVVNEIRRFELLADGRATVLPLRRPDLVIERAAVVAALAARAQSAGAEILFGRRLVALAPHPEGITLILRRGDGGEERHLARTAIGADGAFSAVARAAGWPRHPTVPLLQAIVRLPGDLAPDTVRVWFAPRETPYFYWLIPESPGFGAVGLIAEGGQGARQRLAAFLRQHGLRSVEYQAARVPLYQGWVPVRRSFGGGEVYVVGDAAAQVKVTTVGGIVAGLRGALGVAEAMANGGSSRELRALRRELTAHLLIRRVLHRFGAGDYASLLSLLNRSARRSLASVTRDETPRLLAALLFAQPRLLLLGIRALLLGSSHRRFISSGHDDAG